MTAPSILIVEDNPLDREVVRRLLGTGYDVHECGTGQEAIDKLKSTDFDCVLLDNHLPDVDGLDLIETFRDAVTSVVMLTGGGGEHVAVEAMKRGADDYLIKGQFNGESLRRAVANALDKRTLRSQIVRQQEALQVQLIELQAREKELRNTNRALLAREAEMTAILEQLPGLVWTTDTTLRVAEMLDRQHVTDHVPEAGSFGQAITDKILDPLNGQEMYDAHQQALGGLLAQLDFQWQDRHFACRLQPLRDGDGLVTGTIGLALDVTENRRLEQQLRSGQKMEVLGRLAGSVAHDFNNILMAIISFTEFARESLAGDDPVLADLDEVLRASERATSLVRQLLAVSRQTPRQARVIDPNAAIADMMGMINRLLGEDITVCFDAAAAKPHLLIDPTEFEQVILNLLVNARDAMPFGGEIRITTAQVTTLRHLDLIPSTTLLPGTYATIAIADQGGGIPPETMAHIFEPFFTTKAVGLGTGLGLATCHSLVSGAGGTIAVDSTPGEGTVFTLYLPVTEQTDALAVTVGQIIPRGR
ncbi:MAG: response regulator, partial [Candidatus Sericytochromatia bacterium]|nr:response regulator [Candidatus Sericytochromatia bacterium]